MIIFSPQHHPLYWLSASVPPLIWLLLSDSLHRLEMFRTSLSSTIRERVCTRLPGRETRWDHYPALLWEADGLHWIWLVGCKSHPSLPMPGEGPEEGLLTKPGCHSTALPWNIHTQARTSARPVSTGTVIALCHRTSELQRQMNFYSDLDFEVNSFKEKKELC